MQGGINYAQFHDKFKKRLLARVYLALLAGYAKGAPMSKGLEAAIGVVLIALLTLGIIVSYILLQ